MDKVTLTEGESAYVVVTCTLLYTPLSLTEGVPLMLPLLKVRLEGRPDTDQEVGEVP